jgi:hypothetical protein
MGAFQFKNPEEFWCGIFTSLGFLLGLAGNYEAGDLRKLLNFHQTMDSVVE